jgi:hypothetical protein
MEAICQMPWIARPEIFWNTSQARLRRIVEKNETGINNDEMDMSFR